MSVLVSWGQMPGSPDQQPVLTPSLEPVLSGCDLVQVACGAHHNLFLLRDGDVFANGANTLGQLGVKNGRNFVSKPIQVTSLEAQRVRMIACGDDFSIAVNYEGQVYSWGKTSHGQTAQENHEGRSFMGIRLVRSLSAHRIEGIACGQRHVLVFSDTSRVFSWGCNLCGQLGVCNRDVASTPMPYELLTLHLLPVRLVSAGGAHSFCLSVSGVLFAWGRNHEGQLGLGDRENRFAPEELPTLRSRRVAHVACGNAHTAVRTEDGAVFTFGSCERGQLGHRECQTVVPLPRQVQELMGSRVTQVACGRSHTLALVPADGAVFAFGSGAQGQLGLGHLGDKNCPTIVRRLWDSASRDISRPQLHWLSAGGNTSFAYGRPCDKAAPPPGRPPLEDRELPIATLDFDLVEALGREERAVPRLAAALSSAACLVASCLDEPHDNPRAGASGLNLDVAVKLTEELLEALSHKDVERLVLPSLDRLATELECCRLPLCDVECVRAALLLPATAFMRQLRFHSFQSRLARHITSLLIYEQNGVVLSTWISTLPPRHFKQIVLSLKETTAFIFALPPKEESEEGIDNLKRFAHLEALVKMLSLFYVINSTNPIVPPETFYLPEVIDHIDIQRDLWERRNAPNKFHFCKYLFLFNGVAKAELLSVLSQIDMEVAGNAPSSDAEELPFTELKVRRNFLIADTLDALECMSMSDFKKQLNVRFVGEKGIDQGGVKKEFFLILFREILDPKYGMFQLEEDSRMLWFQPNSLEMEDMFLMIGRLLGLAIYNTILVPLNFPLALFKKLLGVPVELRDLQELQPNVGKNLQTVVDEKSEDNIFGLFFEVTESLLDGTHRQVELVANGGNIAVTTANREDYVDKYVDYVLNRSCSRQFGALKKGFYQVCAPYLVNLFRPIELQNVVRGSEEYEWELLKEHTIYGGCFSREHEVVRWFWDIFFEMSEEEKKKMLLFVTGSDRVPLIGMSGIGLELSSAPRTNDSYFPVAHTCFSMLELPIYSAKAVLKRQLLTAIEHSEGFGIE